jgi:signal transduction histidine kinase
LYIEESKLILNIKDNGIGILAKKKDNPFSMGLLGMNERAKLIGGTLEILSEQGKGTLIKTFVNLK